MYKIFFDDFFSSYKSLVQLIRLSFLVICTMRENSTHKCPLTNKQKIKKLGRGILNMTFVINGICGCKWYDNRQVVVATNFCINSISQTLTRRRNKGAVHEIPMLTMIKYYNSGMGDVDQLDWFLERYRIDAENGIGFTIHQFH